MKSTIDKYEGLTNNVAGYKDSGLEQVLQIADLIEEEKEQLEDLNSLHRDEVKVGSMSTFGRLVKEFGEELRDTTSDELESVATSLRDLQFDLGQSTSETKRGLQKERKEVNNELKDLKEDEEGGLEELKEELRDIKMEMGA